MRIFKAFGLNINFRLALLATLVIAPSTLHSQEFGAFYFQGRSDLIELPDASGFGASFQAPMGDWFQVRLAYTRVSQDTEKLGRVCYTYEPHLGCTQQQVYTSATLSGFRLQALPVYSFHDMIGVAAGPGISFTSLDAEALGENGRRADFSIDKTGQLGFLASAFLSLRPLPQLPLTLNGGFTGHWVNFTACVSYEETYDPFCGAKLFKEIELGGSLVVH